MSRLLLLSLLLQAIAIATSMTVSAQTGQGETCYSVGVPGTPWGVLEKAEWRDTRKIQRSYKEEVVNKINALTDRFVVEQYGALSQDPELYPLYSVRSKGDWSGDNNNKPCVLITGGVHGYETSGVQGALLFLDQHAKNWQEDFRILVFPCVSPWGYETIQRWNCHSVDPNRSFNPDGEHIEGRSFNPEAATEESTALIAHLKKVAGECGQENIDFICHLDLHETTDSDALEFSPAKAARAGISDPPPDLIPDGFYLVSDSTKTAETVGWYTSMIEAVKKITHIAPPEEDGTLIGEKVIQEGVIAIPSPRTLGLCAGVTEAPFATTTEVYPDSATATPEICNEAQVACIEGALEYIRKHHLPADNTA